MPKTTPPHPDRVMHPLGDVPGYLKQRYGETVTRATVYNWVKIGRKGVKLRVAQKSPISATWYTTWEWVREFLAKTS